MMVGNICSSTNCFFEKPFEGSIVCGSSNLIGSSIIHHSPQSPSSSWLGGTTTICKEGALYLSMITSTASRTGGRNTRNDFADSAAGPGRSSPYPGGTRAYCSEGASWRMRCCMRRMVAEVRLPSTCSTFSPSSVTCKKGIHK